MGGRERALLEAYGEEIEGAAHGRQYDRSSCRRQRGELPRRRVRSVWQPGRVRVGVYPGSFDPLTRGHLAVADAARRRLGLDRVDLVVSRDPLGKDRTRPPDLAHRLAVLRAEAARHPGLGVRLTDRRLIADIAEGAAAVVVGADKLAQIVDPAWYGSTGERDRALARLPTVAVAPRRGVTVTGPTPPAGVVELDTSTLDAPGLAVAEVSSTAARAGAHHLMSPLARVLDEATGAWSDPGRHRSWARDPVLPATLLPPVDRIRLAVDGVELAVEVMGDDLLDDRGGAALPTLVLVHGFANDRTSWLPLVPRLAARARLVLVDLRGHGRSGRSPGRYRARDHVDDLVAVLDELVPSTAVLVGHSLAGLLVPAVARRRPRRVAHLVLVDPACFFASLAGARRATYLADFDRLESAQRRWRAQGADPAAVADEIATWPTPQGDTLGARRPRAQLVATAAARLRHDPASYAEVRDGTGLPDLDRFDRDRPLPVPATVLAADAGLDTAFPPEHEDRLRRLLPAVVVRRLAGAGHMVHHDRPGEVAAVLTGLLDPL
ncbi:MAG: alpha/beta fold hydrolase [Actinomyces sp.]|nr:MAG: alpha/beta fold hydrolase [Actinomyces sp.]